MEETRALLLEHGSRYPLMRIEDFIKLLYQSTFGPKHFGDDPDETNVRRYLKKELKEVKDCPHTPLVENIGGDYVRVSLMAVVEQKISADGLFGMFMESVRTSPTMRDDLKRLFKERLRVLLSLIEAGRIPLEIGAARAFVDTYLEAGIRPIGHSVIYREHYHPHYRVVRKDLVDITNTNE